MSRPRIRIDEATTDFERELLGSWEHERPPFASRRRTLALVGSGVAVGATSTTVATGAIGGALAPAAAPKAASIGAVVIAKWVVAGSVVAAGVVTAGPYVSRAIIPRSATVTAPSALVAEPVAPSAGGRRAIGTLGGNAVAPVADVPPPSEVPPAVAVPPAPAEVARAQGPDAVKAIAPAVPAVAGARAVASRGVPAPELAPAPAPETAPARESTAAAATDVAPSPAAAEARPSGSLGDQVASLDTARSALAAGHPQLALRAVDDYDARFPGGMLSQEAAVVRIDALERLGRRDEAAAIGQRFIESHPASPYAAKVRQLLAQPPAEP